MNKKILIYLIQPILSYVLPPTNPGQEDLSSYIQYRRAEDHRYRPSLVSFLHRQPEGSQLASTRYSRIVFHCNILPGSLYLRFSKLKPFRTVVQNRQDPSSNCFFSSCYTFNIIFFQQFSLFDPLVLTVVFKFEIIYRVDGYV